MSQWMTSGRSRLQAMQQHGSFADEATNRAGLAPAATKRRKRKSGTGSTMQEPAMHPPNNQLHEDQSAKRRSYANPINRRAIRVSVGGEAHQNNSTDEAIANHYQLHQPQQLAGPVVQKKRIRDATKASVLPPPPPPPPNRLPPQKGSKPALRNQAMPPPPAPYIPPPFPNRSRHRLQPITTLLSPDDDPPVPDFSGSVAKSQAVAAAPPTASNLWEPSHKGLDDDHNQKAQTINSTADSDLQPFLDSFSPALTPLAMRKLFTTGNLLSDMEPLFLPGPQQAADSQYSNVFDNNANNFSIGPSASSALSWSLASTTSEQGRDIAREDEKQASAPNNFDDDINTSYNQHKPDSNEADFLGSFFSDSYPSQPYATGTENQGIARFQGVSFASAGPPASDQLQELGFSTLSNNQDSTGVMFNAGPATSQGASLSSGQLMDGRSPQSTIRFFLSSSEVDINAGSTS